MSEEKDTDFENFLFGSQSEEAAKKAQESSPVEVTPTQAELKIRQTNDEAFNSMVEDCTKLIQALPLGGKEDYLKIKEQLSQNQLEFHESPSPSELSSQLGLIQMLKDNVLQICNLANNNYIVRKRCYENMFDSYMIISQQKSSDKRKAEATLRLSSFFLDSLDAELFYNYCKQVMENLESSYKTVSRRIVCMQMQVALGEIATAGHKMDEIDKAKNMLVKNVREQLKTVNSEPSEM